MHKLKFLGIGKYLWTDTFIPNWSHNSGTIAFLVYINDLPKVLTTNAKPFTVETSFFSVVLDSVASSKSFNENLKFLHRLTNRRRYLTKMPQKMRKRLFPLAKQAQLTTEIFILTMNQ